MKNNKNALQKNEIEMLQWILVDGVFPTEKCRVRLCNKLEELKSRMYKINKRKRFAKSQKQEGESNE